MITYTSGNAILNEMLGSVSAAQPSTWYFGLCSSATLAGTYTEIIGNGYARVAFTNNKTNWSTSTVATLTNNIVIEFPESTGSWGTISYCCLFDASSAGNMWFFDLLTPAITVATNTTVRFAINGVTATMTNS